jgi:multidrug efflux pump
MGTAVVGGLLIATFLTLFVVPGIYLLVSSESKNSSENSNSINKNEQTE